MIGSFSSYILVGALAGFLAGLLGIGGGLVVVPGLIFLFTHYHFPEDHVVHIALGSSLASIVFTSLSSLKAHDARGAVDWKLFRILTPGIAAGTFFGTLIAARLNTLILKITFILFLVYVATGLIRGRKVSSFQNPPGTKGLIAAGGAIGSVSSLVGIGGGTLSVPLLLRMSLDLRTSIGTSAALGLPIAVSGTSGYLLNGLFAGGLPDHSIGYLYLPAIMGVASASVLTAPLGALVSHRLPVDGLRILFAFLLYFVAGKMALQIAG
jgi:hypothetical protein